MWVRSRRGSKSVLLGRTRCPSPDIAFRALGPALDYEHGKPPVAVSSASNSQTRPAIHIQRVTGAGPYSDGNAYRYLQQPGKEPVVRSHKPVFAFQPVTKPVSASAGPAGVGEISPMQSARAALGVRPAFSAAFRARRGWRYRTMSDSVFGVEGGEVIPEPCRQVPVGCPAGRLRGHIRALRRRQVVLAKFAGPICRCGL